MYQFLDTRGDETYRGAKCFSSRMEEAEDAIHHSHTLRSTNPISTYLYGVAPHSGGPPGSRRPRALPASHQEELS